MSERYTECSRRVFQTTVDELTAFLGIYLMLGITRLPTINSRERFRQSPNPKDDEKGTVLRNTSKHTFCL